MMIRVLPFNQKWACATRFNETLDLILGQSTAQKSDQRYPGDNRLADGNVNWKVVPALGLFVAQMRP
jgi:hypothetical protein